MLTEPSFPSPMVGHRQDRRNQQHQSSSNKELKKLPNFSLSAAAPPETPALPSSCPNILTCESGTITAGGLERLLLLLLLLAVWQEAIAKEGAKLVSDERR
jgi:hypothetical protein